MTPAMLTPELRLVQMYYPGHVGIYAATSGGYCGSVGFQVGQVIMRLEVFLLSAQYGSIL